MLLMNTVSSGQADLEKCEFVYPATWEFLQQYLKRIDKTCCKTNTVIPVKMLRDAAGSFLQC